MSPEAFEPLMNALFAAGAGPRLLDSDHHEEKPLAQCISVLCGSDKAQQLGDLLLNQSTTIGLRQLPFDKRVLPVKFATSRRNSARLK